MSGRTFLDTNILVYAVDADEPEKRGLALRLLERLDPGRLVVSTQVLAEFYVVVTASFANGSPRLRPAIGSASSPPS
jgi:predicted nucleic acid-binding protein